jgi:hypothetical protein
VRRKAVFGRRDDRILKPGDVVEVRTPAEILATLDRDASLEAMPFMPEMLQYSGKRFTVSRRVEKICDTVSGGAPNSPRMRDTVLLEDLRCDGSGHGGCQAGCRLYWKESWLRRVDRGTEPEGHDGNGLAELAALARDGATAVREVGGVQAESYRCQATEALRATEPQSNYDLRQYVRELTSGNVGSLHLLRVAVRGPVGMLLRRLRLLAYHPQRRPGASAARRDELNLRPGDAVQVRSSEEIARTLDARGKTRGLTFDFEMERYCGGRYRVKDRVERIIDEKTGQMIELSSDCVILEGVVCSGEHSRGRWFCPRAIYPYWREDWLRREEDADPASPGSDANAANPESR